MTDDLFTNQPILLTLELWKLPLAAEQNLQLQRAGSTANACAMACIHNRARSSSPCL